MNGHFIKNVYFMVENLLLLESKAYFLLNLKKCPEPVRNVYKSKCLVLQKVTQIIMPVNSIKNRNVEM